MGDFPYTLRKLKAFKWNETSVPPDVTQLWHHLSKKVSACVNLNTSAPRVQCASLYLARSSTTTHHQSVDPIDIYQLKQIKALNLQLNKFHRAVVTFQTNPSSSSSVFCASFSISEWCYLIFFSLPGKYCKCTFS